MQHSRHQPRKKNSAKTNVTISVVIHLILFALGAYWAAHEGVLGKKLQELSVGLIPKEKKPQEEAKKTEPKAEGPKKVEQPKTLEQAKAAAPPPPKFVAPAGGGDVPAPPPAVTLGDGAFAIDAGSLAGNGGDLIGHYKQQVESMLRALWDRPNDVDDRSFLAEVEMHIDAQGKILGYDWKKGTGNQRWDDSVKKVLASSKGMSRPPPKGFPDKFIVRFDTEPASEPLISRAD
jgi:hypothetical protein